MHLLKYKFENDFSKPGWSFLTFPTFKIHANKDRTKKELYTSNISAENKVELNALFESKLKFITPLLLDIGVDFHALSEKNVKKCLFTISEIKPFEYTMLTFHFFGKLSGESINTEFKQNSKLSETYNNVDYKVSFDQMESDTEKILLRVEIKVLAH